jgi:hypothetical protein
MGEAWPFSQGSGQFAQGLLNQWAPIRLLLAVQLPLSPVVLGASSFVLQSRG